MHRTGEKSIGIFVGDVDVESLPFPISMVSEERILRHSYFQ